MAYKLQHLPERKVHVRIGMHTGPCCAGKYVLINQFIFVLYTPSVHV